MPTHPSVRFITFNVSSSYVGSDASVQTVTFPFQVDLEEFAERHGETHRRLLSTLHPSHVGGRSSLGLTFMSVCCVMVVVAIARLCWLRWHHVVRHGRLLCGPGLYASWPRSSSCAVLR